MIVASRVDVASMNMASFLRDVCFVDEELIEVKDLPVADYYIFLSRHEAKAKLPTLTAHFPGNFGPAEVGGNSNELGVAFPSLHKNFLLNLWELRDEVPGFEIVTEPTHHGPTHFDRPVLFVEIGSTVDEWTNKTAGKVMADAVRKTIEDTRKWPAGIAFGGPHYSEKFTKFIIEDEIALGHIMPKYALSYLDEGMFKQMIAKSVEKIKYCVIDWKGCKKRREIKAMAEERGLEVIRL